MSVDAVGRAGDERDVVGALLQVEVAHVGGVHDADLVHLVGAGPVEDGDGEGVALHELVEVGEELGRRQAAVARDRRVRGGAADGQRRALDVPDGHLQDALVHAVVDGQVDADGADLDVAHHAGAREVEDGAVLLLLGLGHIVAVGLVDEALVVGHGLGDHRVLLLLGDLLDGLDVRGDGAGLVVAVPPVGEGRVGDDGDAEQQEGHHDDGGPLRAAAAAHLQVRVTPLPHAPYVGQCDQAACFLLRVSFRRPANQRGYSPPVPMGWPLACPGPDKGEYPLWFAHGSGARELGPGRGDAPPRAWESLTRSGQR